MTREIKHRSLRNKIQDFKVTLPLGDRDGTCRDPSSQRPAESSRGHGS